MDLSIIIVSYETYELTKQTINSVIDTNHEFSFEIITVDNCSKDNSYNQLKSAFKKESENNLIKFIANDKNEGFAVANNIGIKIAKGDFILLLNSDTIVVDQTIENTLDYIKKNIDVGVIGSKVILSDGTLDKACRRSFPEPKNSFYRLFGLAKLFPNNKKFNQYNLSYLDENGIYEVDSLTGAFMLLRKVAIDQVGLLDEDFFMYGEDIDYCYRIKKAGWKIIYYGNSEIIHYKGSSSKKKKSKLIYEFYRAMYLFYNKHYKNEYSIVTTIVTYIGIGFIFLLKLLLNILKFK
ncbi:MAG: glycosyltransferase family 2 protein [Methanobacteriaceae archaeon]|jgi:GT2 family glycosyltransferase|nr:glycosyltransferase family 2 protein [Candidatus Methanorudis spinitermitis]